MATTSSPSHTTKNVWDVITDYTPDLAASVDASARGEQHDVQGVLYLTDVPADAAAFTIVPQFQHRIKSWLQSLPPQTAPSQEDLLALGAIPVPGNAGDLVQCFSCLLLCQQPTSWIPFVTTIVQFSLLYCVIGYNVFAAVVTCHSLISLRAHAWLIRSR